MRMIMRDFIPTDADSIRNAILNMIPVDNAIIRVTTKDEKFYEARFDKLTLLRLCLKIVTIKESGKTLYRAKKSISIKDIKTMTISKAI